MQDQMRPRLARAYTVVMGLAFLEVILQGFRSSYAVYLQSAFSLGQADSGLEHLKMVPQ